MAGKSTIVQLEVSILEMAKEWGVPPWIVEQDCPRRWFDWWRLYREEQAKALKK